MAENLNKDVPTGFGPADPTTGQFKVKGEATMGFTSTITMSGPKPAIGNRIFDKFENAEKYITKPNTSAIPGLILSVFADGEKNGLYQVAYDKGLSNGTAEYPNDTKLKLIKVDAEAAKITLTSLNKGIEIGDGVKDFKITLKLDTNSGLEIGAGGLKVVADSAAGNITVGAKGISVNTTGLSGDGLIQDGTKIKVNADGTTLTADASGLKVNSTNVVDAGLAVNGGLEKSTNTIKVRGSNSITVGGGIDGAVSVNTSDGITTTTSGIKAVGNSAQGVVVDGNGIGLKVNTAENINITGEGVGLTLEKTKSGIDKNILQHTKNGLYANVKLVAAQTSNAGSKTYKLVGSNNAELGSFEIMDSTALNSVELVNLKVKPGDWPAGEPAYANGQYLRFEYVTLGGKRIVYFNVDDLLVNAEFKNGLTTTEKGTVSVKLTKDGGLSFDNGMPGEAQGIQVVATQGVGVGAQGVYFKAGNGLDVDPSTGVVTVNANNSGAITGAGMGLKDESPNKLAVKNGAGIAVDESGVNTNSSIIPVNAGNSTWTTNVAVGNLPVNTVIDTETILDVLKQMLCKVYDGQFSYPTNAAECYHVVNGEDKKLDGTKVYVKPGTTHEFRYSHKWVDGQFNKKSDVPNEVTWDSIGKSAGCKESNQDWWREAENCTVNKASLGGADGTDKVTLKVNGIVSYIYNSHHSASTFAAKKTDGNPTDSAPIPDKDFNSQVFGYVSASPECWSCFVPGITNTDHNAVKLNSDGQWVKADGTPIADLRHYFTNCASSKTFTTAEGTKDFPAPVFIVPKGWKCTGGKNPTGGDFSDDEKAKTFTKQPLSPITVNYGKGIGAIEYDVWVGYQGSPAKNTQIKFS